MAGEPTIARRHFLAHLGGACLGGHALLGCATVPVHKSDISNGAIFLSDSTLGVSNKKVVP